MIEKIMISEPFFSAPAGSTLRLIPNTTSLQVCDICGQKKYCNWYEWKPEIRGMTGMDVCPSCSKDHEINDECYCKDCHWNLDGKTCMIPADDHVTLGEDCPYLEEGQ